MKTTGKINYSFTADVWQHAAPGGWYFVSLPEDMAKEIRENLKNEEEGWGRLKATAEIGSSRWETAIWFDTKKKTYFLPLKGEIRKKEKITSGKTVPVNLWL
jgi:hypothetical protein